MPTAQAFADLLLSQEGDRYVFGVEVSHDNADPDAFDCSELVEWGCARLGVTPKMPDGSWLQARHCRDHGTLVTVDDAIRTVGALLFRFSSSPFVGGRPTSAHVAVSLGDGRTIEARSTRLGVGVFSADMRGWTNAGLVPGLDYDHDDEEDSEMAFTAEQEKFLSDMADALLAIGARNTTLQHVVNEYRARAALLKVEGYKPNDVAKATVDRAGLPAEETVKIVR